MVDELDLKLIRLLQENSRSSNIKLAKELGVSEPTVRRRINYLVKNNMIKFTVLINPESMGFEVSAFIQFSVEPRLVDKISDELSSIDQIYAVSIVSGKSDIIASGYFKNIDEIYEIILKKINKIEGINRVETMIMLKRKKRAY